MELSGRQIQERRFSSSRRGYDRAEVRSFLTECGGHLSKLEEQLRIAEVRATNSDKELAKLRANIDVLLQEATDARRKILDEARAEATAIVEKASAGNAMNDPTDASLSAEAIISEAEAAAALRSEDVERTREAAEEEAAKIMRIAEEAAANTLAEADRALDKARLEARADREEARALKASMEAQSAAIRRILETARTEGADPSALRAALDDQSATDVVIDLRDDADEPAPRHAPG